MILPLKLESITKYFSLSYTTFLTCATVLISCASRSSLYNFSTSPSESFIRSSKCPYILSKPLRRFLSVDGKSNPPKAIRPFLLNIFFTRLTSSCNSNFYCDNKTLILFFTRLIVPT